MRTGERSKRPGSRQVNSGSSSLTVARADEDRVEFAAQQHAMSARSFARDPDGCGARTARDIALLVECELQRDERSTLGNANDVAARDPSRLAPL